MSPPTKQALGALLLTGLLLNGCSSKEHPVAFELRQPDPAQVAEQIKSDSDLLGTWEPGGQAERVRDAFQAANLLAVASDPEASAKLDEQVELLRMSAKSCLIEQGQEPMRKLGLYLLSGFERELEALVAAVRGVPGAAAALLTGAELPAEVRPAFERFARYGGGFLVLAAANDLVRQGEGQGLVLSDPDRFFIRLAFKVYWTNAMPEAVEAVDWILSDFERRWYETWVAERSKTASVDRKLAAIRYLEKQDPAYPAKVAAGIVLYHNRQYALSVKAFELALQLSPGDQRVETLLAEAKRRAD